MQKAIVVSYYSEKRNTLKELNELLADGWKVVSQMPMSGSQLNESFSLVIVEK